jgi:hypothetical protein
LAKRLSERECQTCGSVTRWIAWTFDIDDVASFAEQQHNSSEFLHRGPIRCCREMCFPASDREARPLARESDLPVSDEDDLPLSVHSEEVAQDNEDKQDKEEVLLVVLIEQDKENEQEKEDKQQEQNREDKQDQDDEEQDQEDEDDEELPAHVFTVSLINNAFFEHEPSVVLVASEFENAEVAGEALMEEIMNADDGVSIEIHGLFEVHSDFGDCLTEASETAALKIVGGPFGPYTQFHRGDFSYMYHNERQVAITHGFPSAILHVTDAVLGIHAPLWMERVYLVTGDKENGHFCDTEYPGPRFNAVQVGFGQEQSRWSDPLLPLRMPRPHQELQMVMKSCWLTSGNGTGAMSAPARSCMPTFFILLHFCSFQCSALYSFPVSFDNFSFFGCLSIIVLVVQATVFTCRHSPTWPCSTPSSPVAAIVRLWAPMLEVLCCVCAIASTCTQVDFGFARSSFQRNL